MKKIKFLDNKLISVKEYLMNNYQLTSAKVNKLINNGDIKVNNQKTSYNYQLKYDDEIKLFFLKEKKQNFNFLKTKYNIKIFYEDENILIVNKTRGILCQEDAKQKIETLNNAVKKYLYNSKQWTINNDFDFTPNLCHRLDKYTTGLIIAAKNKDALIEINKAFNKGLITKIYTVLVYGIPKIKEKTLVSYIKQENNIMKIDDENQYNKKIITKYKVIQEYNKHSKLEVELLTGKKHQIRVHLASINHPILGDSKYNKIDLLNYKYPCLNASKIIFNFKKNSFLAYLNKKKFILNKYEFK